MPRSNRLGTLARRSARREGATSYAESARIAEANRVVGLLDLDLERREMRAYPPKVRRLEQKAMRAERIVGDAVRSVVALWVLDDLPFEVTQGQRSYPDVGAGD